MFELETTIQINDETRRAPNLCDRFTDADLSKIGGLCWTGYQADLNSRVDWEQRVSAAMDLALQIAQAKNFPWAGCSNVVFPLISIASLQFSARSYSNIIQGTEVVKYRIVGEDATGEIKKRAERISTHMSWQVMEQDQAWEEQHDRQLINLSIVGFNFMKSFYDGAKLHNTSELVLAQDLVFDYWAKSIEDCARKTHKKPLYRNEVVQRCRTGLFTDITQESWFKAKPQAVPLALPSGNDNRHGLNPPVNDEESPFVFLEQHRWLDLDQDGYAEPYIVTLEETSRKVVRIVARWEMETDVVRNDKKEVVTIRAMEYFTKYGFIPSPDGSIYDIGFGVMLGPLNEAVNSAINQLIDNGTMNNSLGGFLGRGAKFRGGVYTMAPWEWKRVDATGDDLRKNIIPNMGKEPSLVLFRLLELLINYTQRLGGSTDLMQGETPGQNTPAETSRNALEQGMQVYSTIFKRVWRSMKEEFKKLHRLNSIYLPVRTSFGEKGNVILREDYRGNADLVVPVADPSITSEAQRVNRAQAVRMAAREAGGAGYDMDAVEINFLKAMRIEGISLLYPGTKNKPPGQDPKMVIAQLTAQIKSQQMQMDHQHFMMDMQEKVRLNSAHIAQMEATALKLMADAADAKAKQQLETLNIAIESMKAGNEQILERMRLAQEQQALAQQEKANAQPTTA